MINYISKQIYWTYLFGVLVMRIGTSMTIPYLSVYLFSTLHKSLFITSFIISAAPLTFSTFGVIGGILSDKFGAKIVLLSSIFLTSILFLFFPATSSSGILLILNGVYGVLLVFFETASKSLLSEFTAYGYNNRFLFSVRYSAVNLGMALGIWLGSLLIGHNIASIFFFTSIFVGLTGVIFSYIFMSIAADFKPRTIYKKVIFFSVLKIIFKDRKLIFLVIIGALLNIGFSQAYSTFPILLSLKNITNYSKVYSDLLLINMIGVVLLQILLSRLIVKGNDLTLIMIGIVSFSLSFMGFSYFNSNFFLTTSMLLYTFGEIISMTMNSVLLDSLSVKETKGSYFGTASLSNFGQFIGPIFGGGLLSSFGLNAYYFICLVIVLCLPFYIAIIKNEK